MHKIRIKDIARDLGIDSFIVYRSLNNSYSVSEKTNERILKGQMNFGVSVIY